MMLNELDFFSYAVKIKWKRENHFFLLKIPFLRVSPLEKGTFMPPLCLFYNCLMPSNDILRLASPRNLCLQFFSTYFYRFFVPF